jgi:hypothetical protein
MHSTGIVQRRQSGLVMTARQRTLLSLVAGVTLGLGYAGYRIVSDPDVSAAELRSPMFWLELLVAMAVTVAFLVLMVKLRDAILAVVGKIRKIFTRKSL